MFNKIYYLYMKESFHLELCEFIATYLSWHCALVAASECVVQTSSAWVHFGIYTKTFCSSKTVYTQTGEKKEKSLEILVKNWGI